MAKFEIADYITGGNEGGYANNPADRGGETYAGIARNFWPNWEGWVLIDTIKQHIGRDAKIININAASNPKMRALVSKFYKQNFWDVNKLDQFQDQQLGNTVYDFGVNSGVVRAAKLLQSIVHVKDDGLIGRVTLEAVNRLAPDVTHSIYNERRESFYRSIAKGSQGQFLKSWLSRLTPYRY